MQRFGPSAFDDFTGALTKLRQTSTVQEYQTEFEKLANHTEGLPNAFYLSCFISGLKDAIRSKVKMFCPRTMMEALGLAKLAENKIRAQQRSKSTLVPFRPMVPQRTQNPPAPRTTPIKNLSEVEMWEHQEKGFCYNCDENFTWGHICVEQNLYLLDVDSPPTPKIFYNAQNPTDDDGDIQQLPTPEDQP